jgi:hypothetical protein
VWWGGGNAERTQQLLDKNYTTMKKNIGSYHTSILMLAEELFSLMILLIYLAKTAEFLRHDKDNYQTEVYF